MLLNAIFNDGKAGDLLDMLYEAIDESFAEALDDVRGQITDGFLNEPKLGRVYKYRWGAHQASAPGQYPANMTGRMLSSFGFTQAKQEAVISNTAPYAKLLQVGGTNDRGKYVAPRPFLRETHVDTFHRLLAERLKSL